MQTLGARFYLPVRALINSRLLKWLPLMVGLTVFIQTFELPLRPTSRRNEKYIQDPTWNHSLQGIRNSIMERGGISTTPNQSTNILKDDKYSSSLAKPLYNEQIQNSVTNETLHKNKRQTEVKYSDPDFPYGYLINEDDACQDKVDIINIIPIAPDSTHNRYKIRNLWGNLKYIDITGMKTLFMVGRPANSFFQNLLEYESKTNHDIIQLDFIDSYQNLTLKTLSILHWTKTFCPKAMWILKSDEDVFINPFGLKKLLTRKRRARRSDFICRMNDYLKVCRSEDECQPKWAIPVDLYPREYYPPYCDGPAYLLSTTIARKLYVRANKTFPFTMEDAYFTGILAQPLKAQYYDLDKTRFPKKIRKVKSGHWKGRSVFMLNVDKVLGRIYFLWNKILGYNKLPFLNEIQLSNIYALENREQNTK